MSKRNGNLSGFNKNPSAETFNIYHCCVQKTASQWIKKILSDPVIFRGCGIPVFESQINYLYAQRELAQLQKKTFPENNIVSPLYIRYEDFIKVKKPAKYKAFFVMRDPRDLLVSHYFSTRFSHPENPYIIKERAVLSKMPEHEGLLYLIKKIRKESANMYFSMRTWHTAGKKDRNLIVCKYEDLTGGEKLYFFEKLFKHIGCEIAEDEIRWVLEKYKFKNLSGGRKQGIEDYKSHYRKGISGDWKNYFTEDHKNAFKKEAGHLLIDLEYEKNLEW
jgi:hypothetical protein